MSDSSGKRSGEEIIASAEALIARGKYAERAVNDEIFHALADGRLQQDRNIEGITFSLNRGLLFNVAKKMHDRLFKGKKAVVLYDVEDIVQGVGVRFSAVVSGYKIGRGPFSTYLAACVRNEATNILKYLSADMREKEGILSLDDEFGGEGDKAFLRNFLEDKTNRPLDKAIEKEALLQVEKRVAALRALSPRLSKSMDGSSLTSIAAEEGVTKQAISFQLLRLRPKIEKILKGDERPKTWEIQ